MNTAILIGIAAFLFYCRFIADKNCSPKNCPTIVTIFCRLVSHHLKLAWKLLFAVIYGILAIALIFKMQPSNGPQAPEGHFANFADRVTTPIQWVVDGFISIMGIIALAVCFGLFGLRDWVAAHVITTLVIIAAVYILWLVVTVRELVEDEVVSDWTYVENADFIQVPQRNLSSTSCFTWTTVTLILWVSAVALVATRLA